MGKRRYTHIKFLEAEIVAMREAGKTKREIAEHYGLETEQVKGLLKRYRSREKKVAAELQLHSDQGSQYTSQAYFDMTKEYGITPSMSRRGNCYDNAMAENFFSILKTECIYRHQPASFDEARALIDNYIYFYNHQRIQLKTGVAPLTLRHLL